MTTSSTALLSLSPLDGRYQNRTQPLRDYFSEFATIRYRVQIEIEYLIALEEFIGAINVSSYQLGRFYHHQRLRKIYQDFTPEQALEVKEIEKTTNHDLKAVEYWLKDKLTSTDHQLEQRLAPWVHFALTSQDINSSVNILQTKEAWEKVICPKLISMTQQINVIAKAQLQVAMLARTHGQPASPTTMGKELKVFLERIQDQLEMEEKTPWKTKFGGATGNFNAHYLAYPEVNWAQFANNFTARLGGLRRSQYTTQIAHYDGLVAHFDTWKRIGTILIDFCRDIWQYISIEYFKLKIVQGEVGSSAMPHKVNPIDFENAEGNLLLANALFEFLARKLPISRLQRDLTDSTVVRNVGVAMGHFLLALTSISNGLIKLEVNRTALNQDLKDNWIVISEGIQNILKREGITQGYELLKDLTRQSNLDDQAQLLNRFIEEVEVSEEVRNQLRQLTPWNYLGNANQVERLE